MERTTPPERQEIRVLKQRLQRAWDRLCFLERRIGVGFSARVDTGRCEACGICLEVRPFGAVVMEQTARILSERCRGKEVL